MTEAATERDRIIDAAYRCLQVTEGATVAVADILEAAGLGTRAFYRHFGSKDDLVLAMFRRDGERVLAELESAVTAAASPADALRGYASVMMRLVSDRRRMRRVLVMTSEEARRARGYTAELRRSHMAQEAIVARILERGRDDGSFPLVRDARADARSIRAALGQAFDEQVTGTAPVTADQAAEQVADFALRAVGFAATRADVADQSSSNSSIIDLLESILHTDGRTDGVSLPRWTCPDGGDP
jgi:AcrR family transcriptional regulator